MTAAPPRTARKAKAPKGKKAEVVKPKLSRRLVKATPAAEKASRWKSAGITLRGEQTPSALPILPRSDLLHFNGAGKVSTRTVTFLPLTQRILNLLEESGLARHSVREWDDSHLPLALVILTQDSDRVVQWQSNGQFSDAVFDMANRIESAETIPLSMVVLRHLRLGNSFRRVHGRYEVARDIHGTLIHQDR